MKKLRTSCKHLLHLLIYCILIAVTDWISVKVSAARPPTVQINKCCRNGEHLDRTQTCVAGSSEKWAPMIFLIARKTPFDKRGEFPPFFKINENTMPTTCSERELFTGTDNVIFSNGSLFVYEKRIFVSPEDYCADKHSALVCFPQAARVSKVRKCCGPHSAYKEHNQSCEIYTDPNHPLYDAQIIHTPNVEVIYGFPECDKHAAITGTFKQNFLDEATGSLIINSDRKFEPKEFCLEHTVKTNSSSIKINETSINMFACAENPIFKQVAGIDQTGDFIYILYSIGLLISVVFLLATLAAGFLMPSNHHVLHWKCQMYYIFCLLVGDFLLAISLISGHSLPSTLCFTLGVSTHFFFLAAFFWLNIMCFNIWWTFRDFRPSSLEKNQELLRLRIYCAYAWGIPLIIAGVAAILDNIPQVAGDNILRPRFGELSCWFNGKLEMWTYFFGPMGVLLCINLLLFVSTVRQLTCGLWKLDDVKSSTERTALGRVCLKLVVVMGITWIADIISWVVDGKKSVWYVTDLMNALQGVFIFIVVGCQPQVWSALKRLWSSKTGQCTTTTTNGQQHSSSSHGLPSLGDSVTNNTMTNTTSTSAVATTKVPMETIC